jgi:hypothetical protein
MLRAPGVIVTSNDLPHAYIVSSFVFVPEQLKALPAN